MGPYPQAFWRAKDCNEATWSKTPKRAGWVRVKVAHVSFLCTGKFTSLYRMFSAYRLDYIFRSTDSFLRLHTGFNMYCLFVLLFQFIFLCIGNFLSIFGKYTVLNQNTEKIRSLTKIVKIPTKSGPKPKYKKKKFVLQYFRV